MTIAAEYEQSLPEIITERALIVRLTVPRAGLIYRYYRDNLDHLFQWDAETDVTAHSLRVWQTYAQWSEQEYAAKRQVEFIALDQTRSEMLAFCSFINITQSPTWSCDIGFSIAREHQGNGLMTEIARASIDFMFTQMQIHRIVGRYHAGNQRSAALLKRLNFADEGCARSYQKVKGVWSDHLVTALINPAHVATV